MSIELVNVSKAFGETQVLRGLSERFAQGEAVCVMGRSGLGKTTLARIVMGLEKPDAGAVRGAKGKRFALPHARVMIHQPLGGVQGQASEIEIHAREILRMREELNGILAARSGQDIEVVARDTDRDNFMSAQDAVEYGLIDEVLTRDTLESK